jgi:TRAP-type C4-dicarboxylate transport system permease small subunit
MRRLLDGLYLGAGVLAAICLLVVLTLMLVMSAGRQFGLNVPDGDDFAAWSMAAMSFLGLAHTFKRGEMIRVGLLLERLSGRAKQFFEVFSHGVALAFVSWFAWNAGVFAYQSWRFRDMSTGTIAVPLWIPQLALVIGLVILAIAVLDELIHVLGGNPPTFEKPPPKTTEELLRRVAEGGGV